MRRVLVAVSCVVAVVACAGLAATGLAQAPGERTLRFVDRDFRFGTVDNPPRSSRRRPTTSPGDVVTVAWTVRDEAGNRVGRGDQVCTATTRGSRRRGAFFHCVGTYLLRDGSLSFSLVFREGGSDNVSTSAVNGGTGAYEGARGSITSTGFAPKPVRTSIHLLA